MGLRHSRPAVIAAGYGCVALQVMERSADGVLLETGRLVLRQFTMSDVDNLAALDADPDVMRFITGGLATSRDEITGSLLPGFMVAASVG